MVNKRVYGSPSGWLLPNQALPSRRAQRNSPRENNVETYLNVIVTVANSLAMERVDQASKIWQQISLSLLHSMRLK